MYIYKYVRTFKYFLYFLGNSAEKTKVFTALYIVLLLVVVHCV